MNPMNATQSIASYARSMRSTVAVAVSLVLGLGLCSGYAAAQSKPGAAPSPSSSNSTSLGNLSMAGLNATCPLRERGANAAIVARPVSMDTRLVVFPYDANALFPAHTAFNKFTHFEFEPTEKIIASYLNDDSEYEMKVSVTGRDIMVRPKVRGAVGAMTTITDRRRYEIELLDISGCPNESRYQRVSWLYHDGVYEDRAALDAMTMRGGQRGQVPGVATVGVGAGLLPGMPEPAREPDPRELLRVDLKNVNDAYTIEGDPELAPVSVLDDGTRTLIKFPAAMRLRPVLFALSPDGQAEAVSYIPVEAYFVVPNRVFTHGAQLKLGKQEVTITAKPLNCGWWDSACRNASAKRPANIYLGGN